MDVLAAGPVVQSCPQTFDAYWDNRAYRLRSLISRHRAAGDANQHTQGRQGDGDSGDTPADGSTPQPHRSRAKTTPEQQARIWNQGHGSEGCAQDPGPPAAVLVNARENSCRRWRATPSPHRALPTARTGQNQGAGFHRPAAGHGGGRLAAADGPGQEGLLIVSPTSCQADMKQAFAATGPGCACGC